MDCPTAKKRVIIFTSMSALGKILYRLLILKHRHVFHFRHIHSQCQFLWLILSIWIMDICCSEWDKVPFWKVRLRRHGAGDSKTTNQTGMTALTMAGKKGDLIIFRFFNKKFGWIVFSHKWLLVFLYLYMYIWYTWTKWKSSISCRGA